MSKTLIMYYSKYGTTKKYAEWISFELNGDIFDIKAVKQNTLGNYDTIILGSGLYAGKINGIKIILDNYNRIQDKKLVIFTCGLADYSKVEHQKVIYKRLEKEIPENIREKIKVYYLRGGINYKELNSKHKIMMGLLKQMTKKKNLDKIDEEDKLFIETYGQTLDFMDKNSIKELIEYCRK